jgi:hypothetical protein
VQNFWKSHPNLSYRECLKAARSSYR